jgi:predicted GNAT superfamily acetyltransferase
MTETIHDLRLIDEPTILALNNAHAKETSELDAGSLGALLAMAFYARGVEGGGTALLIALDQGAAYESPNFLWFKTCRESFVYIDRIVVASGARGRGIARLLYEDLIATARQAGYETLVCEVNIEPPNPTSELFHAAMGFVGIGEASVYDGTKVVRYFEKML